MNPICEKILKFNLTGNIVPISWYSKIKKRVYKRPQKESQTPGRWELSNQTDHIAIAILADIMYWYRPKEIRSERTGQIIEYRQKFSGKQLQKSYQEYSDLLGAPKKTIKQSVDTLVHLGLINRHFENIKTSNGLAINNTMYLEPNLEKISEITYPPQNRPLSLCKTEGCPSVKQKVAILYDRGTNTENTTETTTENITPPNPPKGGHKRVSSSEPKNKRLNPSDFKPEWMPLEDWKDILEIRKKAKAINTERSLKIYVSELEKAHSLGYSSEQIANTICSHAWRGFKAQWMVNEEQRQRLEVRDQKPEVRYQRPESQISISTDPQSPKGLPDIPEEELAQMRQVGLKKLKELRAHLSHIKPVHTPMSMDSSLLISEELNETPNLDLPDYEVGKLQAVKEASLAAFKKIIQKEKGDI